MKNLFSQISLKRAFYLFTVTTICLLFVVILFASKQYLLYRHCEKLVGSSQHLLFQFTGIKEHINDTLLSSKELNTPELIIEIQGLDSELQNILEDILIPEEFKLNFISQLDLINITISLRNIRNSQDSPSPEQLSTLSTQLRVIHSKLNGFHLLITRYTQTQLLGLHQAVVGLLSIVIALVSIMLLVINRYITTPIIHYCRTLFPEEKESISLFSLHKTIEHLANQPSEDTIKPSPDNTRDLARLYRYSSIGHLLGGLGHELTNLSNGAINYTQAILDLSDDLQVDSDSKQLLQKLFTQEKKMSQLLTNMITFTMGSTKGNAKVLSIDEIFEHITSLVRGTFKNDNITFSIHLNDPALILNNHVSDLQLVILSALQNCRTALNTQFRGNRQAVKLIKITMDDDAIKQNKVVIQINDNGVARSEKIAGRDNQSPGPWHNMSFCKAFLKTFSGSLQVIRNKDNTNDCVISIPFHKKDVD